MPAPKMITYSFDDNDIDVMDPLGSVVISARGHELRAETISLGTFFSALVEVYVRSQTESKGGVDVESEPEDLRFGRRGEALILAYDGQEIVIGSLIDSEQSLIKAIADLLRNFPDAAKNPLFLPLQRFICGKISQ